MFQDDRKLLVGLIGAGIQRSLTPAMHEEEARHHGMRLHYQIMDLDRSTSSVKELPTLLAAARIMGYAGSVGTLRPGANADVSVFELRDGHFDLRDAEGVVVTAKRRLLPTLTLKDGRIFHERPAE